MDYSTMQFDHTVEIPRTVLMSARDLDDVEDWLAANDPAFLSDIRRIRNEDDIGGLGRDLAEITRNRGETVIALRRNDVLNMLERHKAEFADHFGVTALGVFGSVARDEADEDSDVDVVYEMNSPNLFRAARMKRELERILRRRVDVVRCRESLAPQLKARIEREAVYV